MSTVAGWIDLRERAWERVHVGVLTDAGIRYREHGMILA